MTKNHWTGILLGLISMWLMGCSFDAAEIEDAQKLCEVNEGLTLMDHQPAGYWVHCNNGAVFFKD